MIERDQQLHWHLSDLVAWPVTGPLRGLLFILQEMRNMADQELFDPVKAREDLLELELLLEEGLMAPEEYRLRREALLEHLTGLLEAQKEGESP